ncbi:uncharacterized protein FMAN_12057 [Fusarium mangiferae]|uniref:Uncharacterized protein n=1 Tax=Fusarium mangiferae TaxID=192010 RepID=A0A1L7U897_FUSMA|nr:uncharacterized protein FMAN_12057 [Fusarium mangiferae]CVL06968.1 uncharacterized protein FMAN_12057 [Fusarium mangiferae]
MAQNDSATSKAESPEKEQDARNYRDSSVESCIVLAISTIVGRAHAESMPDSEPSTSKEGTARPAEEPIKSEPEEPPSILMSLSLVEPSSQYKAITPEPLELPYHDHQQQKCKTIPILADYDISQQEFEKPSTEERSDMPATKDTPGSIPDSSLKMNAQKATATYLETLAIENKIAKEEELQKKLQEKMDYNCNVILDCDVSIDVECRAISRARNRRRPFWIPWFMERQRYLTSKRKNLQKKNAEMEGVRKRRCKKLEGLMSEKQRLAEELTYDISTIHIKPTY